MIAAAVLSLALLSGGSGALGAQVFSKETAAAIAKVVADASRAAAAQQIVEKARKDNEATLKRAAEIAKQFQQADTQPGTGLADLAPFLDSISAERTRGQKEALDSIFALRKTLTEAEWKALFGGAPGKVPPAS